MLVIQISPDDLGALFHSLHSDWEISIGKKGAIPQRGTTRRQNTRRENAIAGKKPRTPKGGVRAALARCIDGTLGVRYFKPIFGAYGNIPR
jgi:hypothetical protein